MIPYGRQNISEQDIEAVVEVLKSDYLTQGPKVPAFEQAVAEYSQAKYAVATNSATSALHIACLALEIGKGDIVWTSPNSFVASANCALYCGANIDFVDIEINTGNMCVNTLAKKLEQAQKQAKLPKAIIPVHFAGQSCDMQAINKLAKQYGIFIIEDASHAIGGNYQQKPVGSCQYSDITIFSFHPVKIVTSAEGGMALTNSAKLKEKLALYRSHGVVSSADKFTEESHGPWYYQQQALGFNYRMTELQAALGLSQIGRLREFVNKRNELARFYDNSFKKLGIRTLTQQEYVLSAYHLYVIRLPFSDNNQHSDAITFLREQGIWAHVHYIPIHLQPYYQNLGFKQGDFPNAEQYYQQAITLPLYPDLTEENQQYIIEKVACLL